LIEYLYHADELAEPALFAMQPGICDECTRGSFYSMGWLINLKDNEIPYYVDKTFEECSK
jgi:hypothetical protein